MSVAGYRFMEALAWGKFIYIDDLVTHPDARGKGYAAQLLDYVKDLAIEHDLDAVHLDSGPTRLDAHRLYHSKRYFISAHHFQLNLKK
jgi:GNAT superfamily N-acetyltransferase